ncbi:lectin-like domain-containing protein [Kitasatospora albolonga]|uniref:lectin-like domain-containing protein n=1 Tax=Kitasatospora albolonga TaxID=68173 RepID=UPI0031E5DD04
MQPSPLRRRRRRPRPFKALAAAVLGLGLIAAVTVGTPGHADPGNRTVHRATVAFPVREPFDSATNSGTTTGAVTFDNGWMRLTNTSASQTGAWLMNDSFPADLGIIAEFQYASWGGTSYDNKRGDGMAFFLADGAAARGTGALGGALGYACSGTANSCSTNGVPGAFLGIGIDEFGNFSANVTGNSGPGLAANKIVLRGGGNKTTGYRFGTSANGPGGSVETGSRANLRTIRLSLLPKGTKWVLSLWSNSGPDTAMTQLITDFDINTVTDQPKLPSTLRVGFSAGTGGATNNHEVADLAINVPANLSITKTGAPSSARAGADRVTYTVTAANDGTNDVSGARVQDTVPGLTSVSWTCVASTGSTCGAVSGTGNTIDTTADLKRNGTATYTVTGTAPTSPTTLRNTATVTAPSNRTDLNPADNTATAVTEITAGPADIATGKAALGTGPVVPGQTFDYRITTTNRGPADTTRATMTDVLPSPLVYVSSSPGCTANGRSISCGPVANLASGAAVSWTVTVRLDPAYTGDGSDVLNTATSSSDAVDPVPANNTSPAAGPPGGVAAAQADLSVTKQAVGTTPVAPGETFDYKVTVTNAGPSQAVGLQALDLLPSTMAFVSSTDRCGSSGQSVTCTSTDPLAPGAIRTWTFTVRLDPGYRGDGSDVRNTATATATTADPVTPNNTSRPAGPPGGTVRSPEADLDFGKSSP